MTFDVHIGVGAHQAAISAFQIARISGVTDTYRDGDGWECWGEAPGTDVNDTYTQHVIARTYVLGDAINVAMILADVDREYHQHLTPLRRQYNERSNGVIVAVTGTADWAEQFFECQVDGRFRTLESPFFTTA